MKETDREKHLERLARDGYTTGENAIEPSLTEAFNAPPERLES